MDFSNVKVTRGLRLLTHEDLPDEFENWQASLKQVYGLSQISSDLFMNLNHTGKRNPKVTLDDVRAVFDAVTETFSYRLCMLLAANLNSSEPSSVTKNKSLPNTPLASMTTEFAEDLFVHMKAALKLGTPSAAVLKARQAANQNNFDADLEADGDCEESLKRKLSDTNRLFTAGDASVPSAVPASKRDNKSVSESDEENAPLSGTRTERVLNSAVEAAKQVDVLRTAECKPLFASLLSALTHDSWLWVAVSKEVKTLTGAQCRSVFLKLLRRAVQDGKLEGAVLEVAEVPNFSKQNNPETSGNLRQALFNFAETFQSVLPQLQTVRHVIRPFLSDLNSVRPLTFTLKGLSTLAKDDALLKSCLDASLSISDAAPTQVLFKRPTATSSASASAHSFERGLKALPKTDNKKPSQAPAQARSASPAKKKTPEPTKPAPAKAAPKQAAPPAAAAAKPKEESALKRQTDRLAALAQQSLKAQEEARIAAEKYMQATSGRRPSTKLEEESYLPSSSPRRGQSTNAASGFTEEDLNSITISRPKRASTAAAVAGASPAKSPSKSPSPSKADKQQARRVSLLSTELEDEDERRSSLATEGNRMSMETASPSPVKPGRRSLRRRIDDDEEDEEEMPLVSPAKSPARVSPPKKSPPKKKLQFSEEVSVHPISPAQSADVDDDMDVHEDEDVQMEELISGSESEGELDAEDISLIFANAALSSLKAQQEEVTAPVETCEMGCQADMPSALEGVSSSPFFAHGGLNLAALMTNELLSVGSLLRIAGVATSARRLCAISRVERISPEELQEMSHARQEAVGMVSGASNSNKHLNNPYLKSSATMAATSASPGSLDVLKALPTDLLPALPSLLATHRWTSDQNASRLARATYMDAASKARMNPARWNPTLVTRHPQAAPLVRDYLCMREQLVRMEVSLVVWLASYLSERGALTGFEEGSIGLEALSSVVSHEERAHIVQCVSQYRDTQRVIRARIVDVSRPLEEIFATNPLLGFSMDAACDMHDRKTVRTLMHEMSQGVVPWGHARGGQAEEAAKIIHSSVIRTQPVAVHAISTSSKANKYD